MFLRSDSQIAKMDLIHMDTQRHYIAMTLGFGDANPRTTTLLIWYDRAICPLDARLVAACALPMQIHEPHDDVEGGCKRYCRAIFRRSTKRPTTTPPSELTTLWIESSPSTPCGPWPSSTRRTSRTRACSPHGVAASSAQRSACARASLSTTPRYLHRYGWDRHKLHHSYWTAGHRGDVVISMRVRGNRAN